MELLTDDENSSDTDEEDGGVEPWNIDSSDSETFSDLEKPLDDEDLDFKIDETEVNDFVLVKHELIKPRKIIFFIGCVLSIGETFSIKFLRRSTKFENTFIFPNVENIEDIRPKNIVHHLRKPIRNNGIKKGRYHIINSIFSLAL